MSRRHCRLELAADRLLISDLGSTNGTFVNGEPVTSAIILQDGAMIAVGAHRLRYHRRSVDETAEAEAVERELEEAANYVASILPPPLTDGPVLAEWFFQPCARLGGDAFGYQMLDRRHFAAFVLDVAGHGTASALYSVSVVNVLRQRHAARGRFPRSGGGGPQPQSHVPHGATQRAVLHDLVWGLRHPSNAR